jgi:hypothetical protein
MGRVVNNGIEIQPRMLMGSTAERPGAVNAGVQYYNTDTNQLEFYNGTAWLPVGGLNRVSVSSSQTIVANTSYWVDTSGGPVTLTLPASPNTGEKIQFFDLKGTFDSNTLTLNNNSNPIMRTSDTMQVTTEGAAFTLVWSGSTDGWLVENI